MPYHFSSDLNFRKSNRKWWASISWITPIEKDALQIFYPQ
ncbi:hypothetical protein CLONEX_02198 [[Clostridium] nexile DSM 1787]|nr:hypothetical protein CLONEX_02198 [[Clostridium] nexile DSM 1787]